jgi:hypothetical protein
VGWEDAGNFPQAYQPCIVTSQFCDAGHTFLA